ncbi:60S ribosomal protein L4 [Trichonephila clavata]|uniref:60S ribosomal protein L4 n=1 Tax=Trichonephila clavata TaxID=2740835 RepID=A0A8X6KVF1_TRICU|nr:60S ribosomal protein L4 [Trichonephila clavata]
MGCFDKVLVYNTKRFRAGRGKMRNRRRIQKLGPLVIYHKDQGLTRAFRNIPGIQTLNVKHLNLLRLAPGGHVGRFVIWTEGAFNTLDALYGTWNSNSTLKKNYNLPMHKMKSTDLTRLLKDAGIRKAIRPANTRVDYRIRKKNPLTNVKEMIKLNPYALVHERKKQRLALLLKKRGVAAPEKKKKRKVLL